MSRAHSIIRVFSFIAVGIVTIIIGAFMLRGTMHLWDKNPDEDKSDQ
ncbi:MAG: hypothetical protein QW177_03300 [Candidatus Nitrosotenuis sp.]